jgi:hypothetical protein
MHVARVFGLWGSLFVFTQCLAGPLLLVMALILTLRTESFLRRCMHATGTIEKNVLVVERSDNGSVETSYVPAFSFEGNDGRTYTVTSSNSSAPPEFAVGQKVGIFYEPSDPATAKIDSFLQLWTMPLVLAALGVISSFVGYGLVLLLRWRKVKLVPSLAQA